MTHPTHLAALYNAAEIILWVEDRVTAAYLISGKEIIGELVSWIYTRKRPEGPAGLEDLAKAVAEEQTRTGRAPVELLELRDALVGRLTSRVLAST